jgi:hypothetical protein
MFLQQRTPVPPAEELSSPGAFSPAPLIGSFSLISFVQEKLQMHLARE